MCRPQARRFVPPLPVAPPITKLLPQLILVVDALRSSGLVCRYLAGRHSGAPP